MGKFLKLFLTADNWYMFFSEREAKKKAEEIQKEGKKAEIYKEKGDRYMVFKFNK